MAGESTGREGADMGGGTRGVDPPLVLFRAVLNVPFFETGGRGVSTGDEAFFELGVGFRGGLWDSALEGGK